MGDCIPFLPVFDPLGGVRLARAAAASAETIGKETIVTKAQVALTLKERTGVMEALACPARVSALTVSPAHSANPALGVKMRTISGPLANSMFVTPPSLVTTKVPA